MNVCAQRTGFLTLTTCTEPAVSACMLCGKQICASHLLMKHEGPQCPDCAVVGMDADEASRRGLDSSYYRHSAGSHHDTDSYSSSDYENFDASSAAAGGDSGGGGADGGWDDGEAGSGSDSDIDSMMADDSDSGGSGDFQDS